MLRSWFPDSPGQPGRPRRGARPGMEQPYQAGQFQPRSPGNEARGNRARPQNSNAPHGNRANPQNPDAARGNRANPQHADGPHGRGPRKPAGGSPGNSLRDGNTSASPYAPRPAQAKGPRRDGPRKPGGSPGNSLHEGGNSGRRGPGGGNRRGGPR